MKVTDKKRLEHALTVLALASQNVQRVLEDANLTEEEKLYIPGTNLLLSSFYRTIVRY